MTARELAYATGMAKSLAQCYMKLSGVKLHRSKTFKLSNEPFFVEKVPDIEELNRNPPITPRYYA